MSRVKSSFNGDIRRFDLPSPAKFPDLVAHLTSLYSISEFIIKYKDDEGDLVTLASDSDLSEALAGAQDSLLRVDVLRTTASKPVPSQPATSASNEPRTTPVRSPATATEPPVSQEKVDEDKDVDMGRTPEHLVDGLSMLFGCGHGMSAVGRFDVHRGVICDGCNRGPIIGTRHWCTTRPNFDMCDSCIADSNVDKTGLEFRSIEFPWQDDNSGRKVPRPTLVFGSRGVEVMMLQKVLTDLGFMTPDMYRAGVGMYGPNTAKAVNSFREHYGLGVQGQYGVYDDIVAASLMSVFENNVPPSAATGSASTSTAQAAAAATAADSPAAA